MPKIIEPRFNEALKKTLRYEGGYVNHEADPGKCTNLGITRNTLEEWRGKSVDCKDVKNLTVEEASKIYKKKYWEAVHADKILDHRVAEELFDQSVNMGPSQALKLMQRSVNKLQPYKDEPITVDGIIGSETVTATNDLIVNGKAYDLYWHMNQQQKDFYNKIIEKNPDLEVFRKGWMKRAKAEPRTEIEFATLPAELKNLKLSDDDLKIQEERINKAKDNLNFV